MNFISQMTLDKAKAAEQKLFGLYAWHDLSWKLFPEKKKDDLRDFLTRLDAREREFRFTVLSEGKTRKPEWCPEECWKEREIPEGFYKKERYIFQLLANPTKTLSRRNPKGNKKKNGSHFAITKPDELRKWIFSKAEQCGFHVLDEPVLEISPPVFNNLYKKDDEGLLIGVEFKGGLEVVDKTKFMEAVQKGIGRARGFGFGMLVLKPIA